MATLAESLQGRPGLGAADTEWLHQLVGDWQLISDFSFADLLLWVPNGRGGWDVVAHIRPTTGPHVFAEDQVGRTAQHARVVHNLQEAHELARIVRSRAVDNPDDIPVREDYVPVVRAGGAIAVMSRHTNLTLARTPSRLELTYLATADALARMVAAGDFPHGSAPTGMRRGAPRVGDGVLRLDVDGEITWASPNAVSALHRLGHDGPVAHESLARVVTDQLRRGGPVDEGLPLVLTGRQPWRSEVSSGGTVIAMRAIPLTEAGQRFGAVVLVREIGELRRREQELLTKDATIREIHHRVKNNLQSVAALLRLQARRAPDDVAREALVEAERRVGTIALVHETLSRGFDEWVDFDDIAVRGFRAIMDVTGRRSDEVRLSLRGSFGRLRAEDATSLAMILSELVQNAVEHGLRKATGTIDVAVATEEDTPSAGASGPPTVDPGPLDDAEVGAGVPLTTVRISDDGSGLQGGRGPGTGLGTQIVRSLVADLRGTIAWEAREPRGTVVTFTARLRRAPTHD